MTAPTGSAETRRIRRALDRDGEFRRPRVVLWVCAAMIASFFGWAAVANIDEVTRGDGQIVPSGRIQTIQSLEGGILKTLMVEAGDTVVAGQPVARLNETRFRSALLESRSQVESLRSEIARLEAEVAERRDFAPDIMSEVPMGRQRAEHAVYAARLKKLALSEASIDDEMAIVAQQLSIVSPLVANGSVSRMEELELRQGLASLAARKTELRRVYVEDAYEKLSAKRSQLAALEGTMLQRADQLERTVILSPVNGRVNDIKITTRGGVIQPGDVIMEIVPLDDTLLVETRVRPADVAFIAEGMRAHVMLTSYDFSVYGALEGTVIRLSEDTIKEDTPRGEEAFYKVLVRTDEDHLFHGGEKLPIRPGMMADVRIMSGQRTVLNYLIRPLMRARLH